MAITPGEIRTYLERVGMAPVAEMADGLDNPIVLVGGRHPAKDTTSTFTPVLEVPDGELWDVLALAMINATTQVTRSIRIDPRARDGSAKYLPTGMSVPYLSTHILTEAAAVTAGTTTTVQPTRRLILFPGDRISFFFGPGGATDDVIVTALLRRWRLRA